MQMYTVAPHYAGFVFIGALQL